VIIILTLFADNNEVILDISKLVHSTPIRNPELGQGTRLYLQQSPAITMLDVKETPRQIKQIELDAVRQHRSAEQRAFN